MIWANTAISWRIKTIWNAYTDHARWSEWTSIPKSSLVQTGKEHKNGVGAVRKLGPGGPFDAYEEVLVFEPLARMEYTVNKGPLPFRNHLGVVTFTEENGGTRIHWSCTFEAPFSLMGLLMKKVTQFIFDSSLKGLHEFPFGSLE